MKTRIGGVIGFLVAVSSLAPAARSPRAAKSGALPMPSRAWRLAFVRDGDIWLANGDGTGQKLCLKHAEAPSWSPDRKRIAFARDGNVWVAKADGTGARQLTFWTKTASREPECSGPTGRDIDIAWDPVRDFLTFSRLEPIWVAQSPQGPRKALWGSSIYQVPVAPRPHFGLEALWTCTDDGTSFNFSFHAHPAWARDGKRLVFARNGDIWLGVREKEEVAVPEWTRRWDWDVTRVAAVAHYDAPTYRGSRENYGVTHLSWSPDGKLVAYSLQRLGGSGTEEIHLLEVETGKHWEIADPGIDPCFSPDGKWVVYEGVGSDADWGIRAVSRDGKTRRLLVKDGEQPSW